MRSTRCTWIRKNFRAYKANTLAQSDADTLFAHLMFCEGCRSDLWEPQIDRFRESLQGGAWLADLAVHQREARWGSLPTALAASVAGRGARVGHARGLALLGEDRRDRVDVFCRATLVAGTPGGLTVQLPPALEVRGASRTFDAVQQALHHLLPNDLPPVGVEVALDATRPLPKQLRLDGDSLQLPVAIAAASAWLDLPIRTDRIFTGALRQDGLLLEVGDIDAKLYLLPANAQLVLPSRTPVSPAWRHRALLADSLWTALDHAGGPLPQKGHTTLSLPGTSAVIQAVRATLERLPGPGVILALPPNNPTGAELLYLGGHHGLIAMGMDNDPQTVLTQIGAHLQRVGLLSRGRPLFPMGALRIQDTDALQDGHTLGPKTWMDPDALAAAMRPHAPTPGYLPFPMALDVARALWAHAEGAPTAWQAALPPEPQMEPIGPLLRVGKTIHTAQKGPIGDYSPRAREWSDPDLNLPLHELTGHLFIGGALEGGPGDMVRMLAETAVRSGVDTLALDLVGGLNAMALPATPAGLEAIAQRLPGADVWLKARVQDRSVEAQATGQELTPLKARITFAEERQTGPAFGHPGADVNPGLWIVDAHRRSTPLKQALIQHWARTLAGPSAVTVHPGRPHRLLILNGGDLLAADAPAALRQSVETLLRVGPQVGVAVALVLRTPADLDPTLATLCKRGLWGSPGAAGTWTELPPAWLPYLPTLAHLVPEQLLYRGPEGALVVAPGIPSSLPLAQAPVDLLSRFADVDEASAAPPSQGTILPEMMEETAVWEEVGLLLPKVPYQRQVAGYQVFINGRGEIDRQGPPGIRLEILRTNAGYSVEVLAQTEDVHLDGRPLIAGTTHPLAGEHTLRVGDQDLQYRQSVGGDLPRGWPYVAEIHGTRPKRWAFDSSLSIGRDVTRAEVPLPDRQTQADLIWRGTERPVGAEGITLDTIYASGLHGEVRREDGEVTLHNLSSRTGIFVREGATLNTVSPKAPGHPLSPTARVFIGQRIFRWIDEA